MGFLQMLLKKIFTGAALILFVGVFLATPAYSLTSEELLTYWAARYPSLLPRPVVQTIPDFQLAKAQPDECFFDVGHPSNSYNPFLYLNPSPCINAGGSLKRNQAYVWGMAKSGPELWFGTMANTHCQVIGGYLGSTSPILNESYVCEFGESPFSPPVPAVIGDWRPARIFVYNTRTSTLAEKDTFSACPNPAAASGPCLRYTLGLRSGGALGDIVFLGGPSLSFGGGVNLFAYNASDGSYLGTTSIPYSNIRKWLAVNGVLYTAVGGGDTGGAVLKWVGTPGAPFSGGTNGFEVVGTMDSAGAELAFHDGRIFVTTWPSGGGSQAAVFMSPVVPGGGLPASTASWQKVWQAGNYEPDPVTAATYGGGALVSFGSYLYWGTMHVPMLALGAHSQVYGDPASDDAWQQAYLGTHRPIGIFRGQNFGTGSQTVQLLYGLDEMPVYSAGEWVLVPNNMGGVSPLYGQAGFGNFFNNYTWTMSVFRNQLFVGTMDFSYLIDSFGFSIPFIGSDPGADLMRFPSTGSAAIAEHIDGVGNDSTYGVRTMISGDNLYLGMANPMNLHAAGGWELLKLDDCYPFTDFDADGLCSDVDACPEDADNDADSDGVCGDVDNCPANSNSNQADSDTDSLGDACDACPNDADNDVDSDGVCGDVDNCPDTANGDQADSDTDDLGDACDACANDPDNDVDGDGVCGDVDNCPDTANGDQANSDTDNLGNVCDNCPNDPDNDADGDTICGDVDSCPSDADNDSDGDGVCNGSAFQSPKTGGNDNCPGTTNPTQVNSDSDALGDACDPCLNDSQNDSDSDGICGDVDACPNDPNNDADGDGVCGNVDNCPGAANTDQKNSDRDSTGDACDPCPKDSANDYDRDGICGDLDPCPFDRNNDNDGDGICFSQDNCPEAGNAGQEDADNDGDGDVCDLCPNDTANDADGDGVCGNVDGCPNDPAKSEPGVCGCGVGEADTDADSTPDCTDNCPNDPEKTESGLCGCGISDVDSDEDGTPDCNDGCPNDPIRTEPGITGCDVPEGFIPVGADQEVTACNDITLTFDEVTAGGVVNCSASESPSSPANFKLLGQTVELDFTGEVAGACTVCFPYDESLIEGEEGDLQLLHREDEGSEWQDITTSIDTEQNIICGEITSFSEFTVAEPAAAEKSGGGGGGGGCFIAAAANASTEPHVLNNGPAAAILILLGMLMGLTGIAGLVVNSKKS